MTDNDNANRPQWNAAVTQDGADVTRPEMTNLITGLDEKPFGDRGAGGQQYQQYSKTETTVATNQGNTGGRNSDSQQQQYSPNKNNSEESGRYESTRQDFNNENEVRNRKNNQGQQQGGRRDNENLIDTEDQSSYQQGGGQQQRNNQQQGRQQQGGSNQEEQYNQESSNQQRGGQQQKGGQQQGRQQQGYNQEEQYNQESSNQQRGGQQQKGGQQQGRQQQGYNQEEQYNQESSNQQRGGQQQRQQGRQQQSGGGYQEEEDSSYQQQQGGGQQQQGDDQRPELERLRSRMSHSINDVVMWRDVVHSASVFGVGLGLLLVVTWVPVTEMILYALLLAQTVALALVGLKYFMTKVSNSEYRHPLAGIIQSETTINPEPAHRFLDSVLRVVNAQLISLKRLVLAEDIGTTLKFAATCWALTYVATWFPALTLMFLFWIGLFTVPKVYTVYRQPIDRHVGMIRNNIGNVENMIVQKVPQLRPLLTGRGLFAVGTHDSSTNVNVNAGSPTRGGRGGGGGGGGGYAATTTTTTATTVSGGNRNNRNR